MDNLDLYLSILQKLNQIKYTSPIPIAKEILEYSKGKDIVINEIIERLTKEEPWEYIKGTAEFYGDSYKISPAVLIPRIETEQIISTVISRLKIMDQNVQIIDTGTGSGVIILTLEKLLQNKENIYLGTDISLEAIKIATENRNNSNVIFTQANLLETELIKTDIPTIIVANLPYIPTKDIPILQNSVKNYEPIIALDGGEDGLVLYRELLKQIEEINLNLIYAIFEFDPNTEKEMKTLIEEFPKYSYKITKDIYEQNRFLEIERRLDI